jgi:hypothetical protein
MSKPHGLRGIAKVESGKWQARLYSNGRRENLGRFATKEQAAAAYDGAARLNKENAVCNYDSPEDAARAIYEAREINLLSSTVCLQLIMEACGPAEYEEALRQVHAVVIGEHAIWRVKVAAVNLRKAEKTATCNGTCNTAF